ncbi:MAG: hypothetical protein IPK82_17335 [Polyangiaceae bacterium]|nr:hypothetical protein [Polyangiaceae bacterium]
MAPRTAPSEHGICLSTIVMIPSALARFPTWGTAALGAFTLLASGCAPLPLRRFPLADVLWNDPDQNPHASRPAEREIMSVWDGMDKTVFQRASNGLRFHPSREAINVNALDEVPNSSWFTNRLGWVDFSPEHVARGACTPGQILQKPWKIVGGKPNGINPGFIIVDAAGKKALLKFDGNVQAERNSAADAIGAALYYSAGYYTPCNQVVAFVPTDLTIQEGVTVKNELRQKVPLTLEKVQQILQSANTFPNGQLRAGASIFIDGKTLGPWSYLGIKEDDPNDVVPHEHRRELRGMKVLAALTDHIDSREENTMMSFISGADGRGYIRHYMLDLSDTFGSIWVHEPKGVADAMSRRLGFSNYLDLEHIPIDFLTFGVITRPWDKAQFSPDTGNTFGYYEGERFVPDTWHNGYPNPAFANCTERDAAWMARIVAELSHQHLEAVSHLGKFTNERYRTALVSIVKQRRTKILERYLTQLSPLMRPTVEQGKLCVVDAAVRGGIRKAAERLYSSTAYVGNSLDVGHESQKHTVDKVGGVCFNLPNALDSTGSAPVYIVIDLIVYTTGADHPGPARVHLYQTDMDKYQIVGLERPSTFSPPK